MIEAQFNAAKRAVSDEPSGLPRGQRWQNVRFESPADRQLPASAVRGNYTRACTRLRLQVAVRLLLSDARTIRANAPLIVNTAAVNRMPIHGKARPTGVALWRGVTTALPSCPLRTSPNDYGRIGWPYEQK
jgi:hypothetical protein